MMTLIDVDEILEKIQFFGEQATYDDPFAEIVAAVKEEDILNATTYNFDEVTTYHKQKVSGGYSLICEECGYEMYLTEDEDIGMIHFCPHCGRPIEIKE